MPRLCVGGTGGKYTKGYVLIHNDTICTFKVVLPLMKSWKTSRQSWPLQRKDISSQQMEKWEQLWPAQFPPQSQNKVKVKFKTRRSIPFHLDYGKVTYEAYDNADLSLGEFSISVDSSKSTVTCCCFWTFKGQINVDWETLPKVFGVSVEPREATGLPFRKLATTRLHISGNVLKGGSRDISSSVNVSEFAPCDVTGPLCRVGDVVAAYRGAFRVLSLLITSLCDESSLAERFQHMGIVSQVCADGEVRVSHLSGTAAEVIGAHGLGGGVREVWQAISGSHGSIAGVQEVSLAEFAANDPVRVENLHDDEWKAYEMNVLRERMAQAFGTRDYSLFEFNCEHYANLIRYGMPHSVQIEAMKRKLDFAHHGRQIRHNLDNFRNEFGEAVKGRVDNFRGHFQRKSDSSQATETDV